MPKTLITRDLAQMPEVRAEGADARLVGYAAVFNQRTEIAGLWIEEVAPGAFAEAIADGADVRALFNHDANRVLGRTAAGTLALREDETGLRYEITPDPTDPEAMSVLAKVRRGDVTGSSMGFTVRGEEWQRATEAGQLPVRRITAVDWLRDVGPVTFPAYEQTTAEAEARSQAEALRVVELPDLRVNQALALQLALDEVEG